MKGKETGEPAIENKNAKYETNSTAFAARCYLMAFGWCIQSGRREDQKRTTTK